MTLLRIKCPSKSAILGQTILTGAEVVSLEWRLQTPNRLGRLSTLNCKVLIVTRIACCKTPGWQGLTTQRPLMAHLLGGGRGEGILASWDAPQSSTKQLEWFLRGVQRAARNVVRGLFRQHPSIPVLLSCITPASNRVTSSFSIQPSIF